MKRLYLILSLCIAPMLGYATKNPTESKNVFATDGAIWNVGYMEGQNSKIELSYGLIGDTVVAGKQYNKLYAMSDTTLIGARRDIDYLIGAFREENGKVWFLPLSPNEGQVFDEYLMYDFSAKVGDVISRNIINIIPELYTHIAYGWSENLNTEIKNIWTDKEGRRHFEIKDSSYDTEWIEGIGGNGGLFWTYMVGVLDGINRKVELSCFKQNEEILYRNNRDCSKCFCENVKEVGTETNMNAAPALKAEAVLSPNPVKDDLNVTVPEEMVPCVINLYSATGDFVTGKRLTKAQDQMSMTGMDAGLYLYRIATDGGELLNTGKICK